MRILLDHNLPRRLRTHLPGHQVRTAREMLWEELRNGVLIKAAADAHFEVFITIDKNLEHEQNLLRLPLPVVVLDATTNALPGLLPVIPFLCRLLESQLQPVLYILGLDGTVLRLTERRQG